MGSLAKATLIIAALALCACETPIRLVTADGSYERGAQLLWGERSDLAVAPGKLGASSIEKKTIGTLGGLTIGAVAGALAGQPMAGAAVGAVAGAAGQAMDKDTQTTGTVTKP